MAHCAVLTHVLHTPWRRARLAACTFTGYMLPLPLALDPVSTRRLHASPCTVLQATAAARRACQAAARACSQILAP